MSVNEHGLADDQGLPSAKQLSRAIGGRFGFGRVSAVYVWAALIVCFAVWIPDTFLTGSTLRNIAGSNAITAILALGLLLPLTAGAYDLSIAQTLGTSAMLSVWMVHQGLGTGAAIALTVCAGLAIGLMNATLIVICRIDSFIATLGTASVLLAVAEAVSGGVYIVGVPSAFQSLGTAQPLGIPIDVVYLAVLAVVLWCVLERTPFGRYLRAIGGGREAARLAGVRVRAYLFIALVVSSVVAACAGVIVTAQVNSGSPTTGPSYLLPAYAAAFLGATQIRPGRMNVVGLLIANYMLATGVTGLQLGGARFWIPDLFNGAALVIAVGLSGLTVRRRKARANERERVELFGAPPAEDSPRVAPGGGESSENSVRDRPASLGR